MDKEKAYFEGKFMLNIQPSIVVFIEVEPIHIKKAVVLGKD